MPADDDDPMKNVVTTWGRDVIFQTPGPPDSERTVELPSRGRFVVRGPGPTVVNFQGYRQAGTSLELDEMPESKVDVVGHDVQIDPGASYCPFVRLALARYQADSVPRAELSRVVLSDFAQLLPDRTVNVAASADGKRPSKSAPHSSLTLKNPCRCCSPPGCYSGYLE